MIAGFSELPKPKDSVRSVAGRLTEYCFYADQETVANLERLKEIWSAKMSGASWSEIIAAAIQFAHRHSDPYEKDQAKEQRLAQVRKTHLVNDDLSADLSNNIEPNLEKAAQLEYKDETTSEKCRSAYSTSPVNLQNVPSLRQITIESGQSIPESQQNAFRSKPHTAGSDQNASSSRQHTSGSQQNSFRSKQNPSEAKQNLSAIKAKRSRYLSVSLKNRVRIRDQDQCTYVDPGTHVRCASRYALQFDHIHLYSKGGEHSEENLRLRCQTHNLLEAWDKTGAEKMRGLYRVRKKNLILDEFN